MAEQTEQEGRVEDEEVEGSSILGESPELSGEDLNLRPLGYECRKRAFSPTATTYYRGRSLIMISGSCLAFHYHQVLPRHTAISHQYGHQWTPKSG